MKRGRKRSYVPDNELKSTEWKRVRRKNRTKSALPEKDLLLMLADRVHQAYGETLGGVFPVAMIIAEYALPPAAEMMGDQNNERLPLFLHKTIDILIDDADGFVSRCGFVYDNFARSAIHRCRREICALSYSNAKYGDLCDVCALSYSNAKYGDLCDVCGTAPWPEKEKLEITEAGECLLITPSMPWTSHARFLCKRHNPRGKLDMQNQHDRVEGNRSIVRLKDTREYVFQTLS
jgi:hypothetical protein